MIHQISIVRYEIVVNMAKVSPRLLRLPWRVYVTYSSLCYVTGEYLKRLFATPFGSKCSKVDVATSSAINETSSQCQHSFHENENITFHVTPSEDCDEVKQGSFEVFLLLFFAIAHFYTLYDATGEELKKLFATPGYVSHSKEEKEASLDGDSREEGLKREGQG